MIELLLLIIAMTLLYTVLPIISIYAVIKAIINSDFRQLKVWFYGSARSIDMFGNVIGADLFNDIFITKDGYKFGKRGETISSVLGKNQLNDTLTIWGNRLRKILDFIETDHCLLSILTDDEINQKRK